jgi:hypothetical protein
MNTAITIAMVAIMSVLAFVAAGNFGVMKAFAQAPVTTCKPSTAGPGAGPQTGAEASACGKSHIP